MCEWRWTLFRIWDGYATPPFWHSCQCGSTPQQLHQVGEHARRTRERSADFRWNDAPHVALLLTPSFEDKVRVAGDIGMDEHGRNHNDGIGYPRSIFLHLR